MKEVIDHARFWAVLANLQVKSGIHVHRHGFDLGTTLCSQLFEKRSDRRPAAAFTDPQHSSCIRIQHNAGVTMTFEQRELVHHQASRLRLRQKAQRCLQGSTFQQPNGVPMQPK
ncbi:hypothetical protein D3C85_1214920 [compost metagenome]